MGCGTSPEKKAASPGSRPQASNTPWSKLNSSVISSVHVPVRGSPITLLSASVGENVPENGASPASIETPARSSSLVFRKLSPLPPTAEKSRISVPAGLTRRTTRSES
jgi:hypothetical protein